MYVFLAITLSLCGMQGVLQVKVHTLGFHYSKLKILSTHMLCFVLFCKKLTCKVCVAEAVHLGGPLPLSLGGCVLQQCPAALSDNLCIIYDYVIKALQETVSKRQITFLCMCQWQKCIDNSQWLLKATSCTSLYALVLCRGGKNMQHKQLLQCSNPLPYCSSLIASSAHCGCLWLICGFLSQTPQYIAGFCGR